MVAAYWKLPTRRWLLATRASTAPGSSVSRCTGAPGGHDGQRPGRGDAQRVHRLADDVLAQHRPDRGQAVAAARERRASRALEVQVAQRARPGRRARRAAARARRRAAGRSRRTGARRRPAPPGWRRRARRCRPGAAARRGCAASRVEAELGGQRLVEHQQPRVGSCLGLPADGHLRQLAGEAVVGRRRLPVRASRRPDYGGRADRFADGVPDAAGGLYGDDFQGQANARSSSTCRCGEDSRPNRSKLA